MCAQSLSWAQFFVTLCSMPARLLCPGDRIKISAKVSLRKEQRIQLRSSGKTPQGRRQKERTIPVDKEEEGIPTKEISMD